MTSTLAFWTAHFCVHLLYNDRKYLIHFLKLSNNWFIQYLFLPWQERWFDAFVFMIVRKCSLLMSGKVYICEHWFIIFFVNTDIGIQFFQMCLAQIRSGDSRCRDHNYGSVIYNYLCNQCLSPLNCEFETSMTRCTRYNIMW